LRQINPVDSNRTIKPLHISLLVVDHMGTGLGILKGVIDKNVMRVTINAAPEIQA